MYFHFYLIALKLSGMKKVLKKNKKIIVLFVTEY